MNVCHMQGVHACHMHAQRPQICSHLRFNAIPFLHSIGMQSLSLMQKRTTRCIENGF